MTRVTQSLLEKYLKYLNSRLLDFQSIHYYLIFLEPHNYRPPFNTLLPPLFPDKCTDNIQISKGSSGAQLQCTSEMNMICIVKASNLLVYIYVKDRGNIQADLRKNVH